METDATLAKLILTSGLLQLSVGVLLGWPLALFHTGLKRVGPIRNVRRLLQCHIDDLMMGTIQIALSLVAGWASLGAVLLIMIGSWTNAHLFLVQACMKPTASVPSWLKVSSVLSFGVITIGYVLFVPAVIRGIWT